MFLYVHLLQYFTNCLLHAALWQWGRTIKLHKELKLSTQFCKVEEIDVVILCRCVRRCDLFHTVRVFSCCHLKGCYCKILVTVALRLEWGSRESVKVTAMPSAQGLNRRTVQCPTEKTVVVPLKKEPQGPPEQQATTHVIRRKLCL